MISFIIDPTFAKEAVLKGRVLIVEVYSAKHHRVIVGDPSPHPKLAADMAKRKAA